MSEIHYTNSWFNLREFNEISLVDTDGNRHSKVSFLPPGRYSEIQQLIALISSRVTPLESASRLPILNHNEYSRRVTLVEGESITGSPLRFQFGRELAELLGVSEGLKMPYPGKVSYGESPTDNETTFILLDSEWEAKRAYDITGGIHNLMVYSDVVDYSVVGDVRAQLLRTVRLPPDSKFGESVVIVYQKPYYIPLANRDISSITIEVKDDSGEPISFQFGRVEVVLHFMKDG